MGKQGSKWVGLKEKIRKYWARNEKKESRYTENRTMLRGKNKLRWIKETINW